MDIAIDGVKSVVNNVGTWLWDKINYGLSVVSSAIDGTVRWVWTNTRNAINGVLNALSGIGQFVSDSLKPAIEGLKGYMETVLHGALSGVAGALGDGLKVVYQYIIGGLQWAATQIAGFVSWAIDSLKTYFEPVVVDLTNRMTMGLKGGSPPIEIEESMKELVNTYYNEVTTQIEKTTESPLNLDEVVGIGTAIATTTMGVTALVMALSLGGDAVHPQKELGIRDLSKTLLSYIGANRLAAPMIVVPHEEGVVTGLKQYFKRIYRLGVPSSRDLVTFLFRGKIDEDRFKDYMARQGYPDFFMDAFKEAGYTIADMKVLFELMWREEITEDEVKSWMAKQGVHPDLILPLVSLSRLIPPAVDLVTMVVREAFIPEFVTPAPAVFAVNMKKKGYSKEWADRYWTMHWVPMPITQAADAVHRGYMTEDEYDTLLKIHDFHPMWRGLLKKVVYRTFRIRDMRIGWELGVLSDDELTKRLMDYGYSKEDVGVVANITKHYALAAEIGDVRREIIADYVEGFITVETLRANLTAIGTAASVMDYYVEKAKMRASRDLDKEKVKLIRAGFKSGVLTEEEAVGQMQELGLRNDTISVYIELDKMKRKVDVELMRSLTTSQMLKAYKEEYITETEVKSKLKERAYSDKDVDLLVIMNKPKLEGTIA